MASAPTQKHLSEGLSEGGEEDFWCNRYSFSFTFIHSNDNNNDIYAIFIHMNLQGLTKVGCKDGWATVVDHR